MKYKKAGNITFRKKGMSTTTKMGNYKLTVGPNGITTSLTSRLGAFSITTQTRNGKTSTRINKPRLFRKLK